MGNKSCDKDLPNSPMFTSQGGSLFEIFEKAPNNTYCYVFWYQKFKFPKMHDIGAKKSSKSKKQTITNLYHIPQYNGYDKFVRIP